MPLGNVVTVGFDSPLGPLKMEGKRHEKEVGHGGKWRKTWQNEEIAGRKRRKAERYAGHRVKQMQKKVRSRRSAESNGRWGSDQDRRHEMKNSKAWQAVQKP